MHSTSPEGCMCQIQICQVVARLLRDFLTKQNIVTPPRPDRSPVLAENEHVFDILGRNVRCCHDVRARPQMVAPLRREWAAIPQNDIRSIIGSMRRRCNARGRADGGHISNKTLCDIEKMTPTLFFEDFQTVLDLNV